MTSPETFPVVDFLRGTASNLESLIEGDPVGAPDITVDAVESSEVVAGLRAAADQVEKLLQQQAANPEPGTIAGRLRAAAMGQSDLVETRLACFDGAQALERSTCPQVGRQASLAGYLYGFIKQAELVMRGRGENHPPRPPLAQITNPTAWEVIQNALEAAKGWDKQSVTEYGPRAAITPTIDKMVTIKSATVDAAVAALGEDKP